MLMLIRLIVFSPGFSAFSAPEEPHLAFISRTKLPQPPVRCIISAVFTLYPCCGHSHFPFFKDCYLSLLSFRSRNKTGFYILFKSAFPAFKNIICRKHHAFTFGTKLHQYHTSRFQLFYYDQMPVWVFHSLQKDLYL